MHYFFSTWRDELKEAARQREIDAAQARMAQMQNEQYERALKQMVSSNDSSLMHYFFAAWRDELKEAARQREIDAAKARMAQMHNAQYERALKQWVSSNDSSLMHYFF